MSIALKIFMCVTLWLILGVIGSFCIIFSDMNTEKYSFTQSVANFIHEHLLFFIWTGPISFVLGISYIIYDDVIVRIELKLKELLND